MKSNAFLQVFYEIHQSKKCRDLTPGYLNFEAIEEIFLGIYELGKYEVYVFLYAECKSFDHFCSWLLALKGEDFLAQADTKFNAWLNRKTKANDTQEYQLLNEEQLQFWQEQGYLKIGGLIAPSLCDNVKALICNHLGVSLEVPESWYQPHPDWHGLMLQLYQHESIEAIRKHPNVFELFSELYASKDIIANTEKVSFNPPVTHSWTFSSGELHWDIDSNKPIEYYIQGLIYLDDVPADRGPLKVVPGFHLEFEEWMKSYPAFDEAHNAIRRERKGTGIPGKKGDIIVWRHTLPHAASANYSSLPRFVQYLSFSKL